MKTEVMRIRQVWKSLPEQLAKENKKFIFGVVRVLLHSNEEGLTYLQPRIILRIKSDVDENRANQNKWLNSWHMRPE